MSQRDLANRSGVSIRVIQLAEQRQRSVDNMSAHTLYLLATALECPMESLLEHDFEPKIEKKH
jgi:transcriptional regulator with XRE-family HTH domain